MLAVEVYSSSQGMFQFPRRSPASVPIPADSTCLKIASPIDTLRIKTSTSTSGLGMWTLPCTVSTALTSRSCGYNQPFMICCRAAFQHAREMLKMQHPLHMELLPLVECALAALRMSCERFFLLISVFAAYLLFSTKVPHWFKLIVRFNHRLSKIFQKVAHSLHTITQSCSTLPQQGLSSAQCTCSSHCVCPVAFSLDSSSCKFHVHWLHVCICMSCSARFERGMATRILLNNMVSQMTFLREER